MEISQLANVFRGASPRPIDSPVWFDSQSRIGWLRISDVTASGKFLEETTQNLSAAGIANSRFVKSGNLVMSICATVGRPIITRKDVCIHDGFVVFDNLRADKEYLYYCLSNMEAGWSKHGQTGSQMNLNTGLIDSTPVPVPPPTEQRAIAEALSDVDKLLGSLEKLIAKKRAIKQAAMQQLLTGKTRLPGFSRAWGKKRTEVGIIPRDWECLRLGDVVNLLTGFPFPSSGYTNSGVLLVRGSNVKRGVLDWDDDITRYWPTIDSATKQYELRKGDLVIAMDGALVGRSYAVISDTDLPSLLLQRVARIRSSQVHQDLLAFLVAGDPFINHVDVVKTHTAIPHISPDDIRNFLVTIPTNTAEQCAIATILSDMDAEIAALEQRRDKTRAIKQGMMQQLLTGRVRLVKSPSTAEVLKC